MLTKLKIALAAALVLGGTASTALARGSYGGPVQTWCDINPECNGWDKRMKELSHRHAGDAYGYAKFRGHTSHAQTTHAR
jgi:hypothetical protein